MIKEGFGSLLFKNIKMVEVYILKTKAKIKCYKEEADNLISLGLASFDEPKKTIKDKETK